MVNEFIKYVQEDEDILYGYVLPPELYNLDSGRTKYVLITKYMYKVPDKFKDLYIIHLPIQLYFKYVTNCDIFAWILSCLDKKYIIKEHVKMIMMYEPIKLRTSLVNEIYWITEQMKEADDFEKIILGEKAYKYCMFANQIVENHKITNYKILGTGLKKIQNKEFYEYGKEFVLYLSRTKSIWEKNKLKHLINGK